jgi:hypothetical protein
MKHTVSTLNVFGKIDIQFVFWIVTAIAVHLEWKI